MLKKRITFIGPGVMAEAMIAGLLKKKQPDGFGQLREHIVELFAV